MNNPDIPEMCATDTSGLGTRTVIQGGREASYLIRSYAKGPRAYVTGPMEQLGVVGAQDTSSPTNHTGCKLKGRAAKLCLGGNRFESCQPDNLMLGQCRQHFSAKHETRG